MNNYNEWDSDYLASLQRKERRAGDDRLYSRKRSNFVRKSLVQLLIKTSDLLDLPPATLHLSVSLLDAVPDIRNVRLMAVTCLWIASKVSSESFRSDVPSIGKLQMAAELTAERKDLIAMETDILQTLKYDVGRFATANDFINYWCNNPHSDCFRKLPCLKSAADKVCRSFMTEESFRLRHPASVVGAACVEVARIRNQMGPQWPDEFRRMTGYRFDDIDGCVKDINRLCPMVPFPLVAPLIRNQMGPQWPDEFRRMTGYRFDDIGGCVKDVDRLCPMVPFPLVAPLIRLHCAPHPEDSDCVPFYTAANAIRRDEIQFHLI